MNIIESLNKYSSGFSRWFYGDTAVSDMESYRRGKVFLQKYALDDDTFRKECAPVMQEVFRLNEKRGFNLQEMSVAELFQDGFHAFAYFTSHIFLDKEHFMLTQSIGKQLGDNYLYIIEEDGDDPDIAFRLRFPMDISWEELCSGGCISDVLFKGMEKCYYVFGDSGRWGKWCDYENSWWDYELFGYKTNCNDIQTYMNRFSVTKMEYDDMQHKIGIPKSIKCYLRIVGDI